jgi:hypothetical protein
MRCYNAAMPAPFFHLDFLIVAATAAIIVILGLRPCQRPATFYNVMIWCGIIALLFGMYVTVGTAFLAANNAEVRMVLSIPGWSLIAIGTVLIARGARGNRP